MGVGIDDAKRGPIWLDGLDCQGNETSILDCDHGLTGETEYCGHREDVAVSCVVGNLTKYLTLVLLNPDVP